ncbi:serine O-acetyltransferase [Oryzibacter oryziterrae]|uniref:serine O-acetyltransferase n=1 Tax=Oryzibacter oryziterrae TaxID=2766474 RepID=UPI001F01206D|nr:serine O-acetyltransferase [Oryzibacter oryziterrae]
MSSLASARGRHTEALDPVWARLRLEASAAVDGEPALGSFLHMTILDQVRLEDAVIQRVADRLGNTTVLPTMIAQAYQEAVADDPSICEAFRSDIMAVYDRDPACDRLIEPLLYFKGFHAIQAYRLSHWLWTRKRRDFALYIQSRSSEVFQTDINPGAKLGRGLFFDHATGIVIGETAVVDDDVSILQDVTLGGTGKETGDRHPKIRAGVLIGAGAKILGNIEVGSCSRVAAGSVVLKPVPRCTTVAGVPAKVIGEAGCAEPSHSMEQRLPEFGGEAI